MSIPLTVFATGLLPFVIGALSNANGGAGSIRLARLSEK